MATEAEPTLAVPAKKDFYLDDKPCESAKTEEKEAWEGRLVQLAMLAEKAERYDDMCKYLQEVVNSKSARDKQLAESERNLLSVAFKNVVGGLRSSWRSFEKGGDTVGVTEEILELNAKYSALVEQELEDKCLEVLKILENSLIPMCKERKESYVFFLKMCGDYYRYLAEFRQNETYKDSAKDNYENAYNAAKDCLAATHPTRLGLALNFSVCYYEILKKHQKACALAKRAFDEAIQKLDTLNDANYKDSTLIMQLLRDNLTLWTSEKDEDAED